MSQYHAMNAGPAHDSSDASAQLDGQGEQPSPFLLPDADGPATRADGVDTHYFADAFGQHDVRNNPSSQIPIWSPYDELPWSGYVSDSCGTQPQLSSSALSDPALFGWSADLPDFHHLRQGDLTGKQAHSTYPNLVESGSTDYTRDSIDQQQATHYMGSDDWKNNNALQTPNQVSPLDNKQDVTMQDVTTVQHLPSQSSIPPRAHEPHAKQPMRLPVHWGIVEPHLTLSLVFENQEPWPLPIRADYSPPRRCSQAHTDRITENLVRDHVYGAAMSKAQVRTFVNKVSKVVEDLAPEASVDDITTTTDELCREVVLLGRGPTTWKSQHGSS